MSSRRKKASAPRGQRAGDCEWIGGLVTPPFYVEGREEPVRAGVVVWMEPPSQLVVGHDVVAPEDVAGAVGRVLRAALARPAFGPPRQPDHVRVPDAAWTAEVRAAIVDSVPVTVAPTPELDALMARMFEQMPPRPRRNDPCHCGSGKKYKHCHLAIDAREDPTRGTARRFLDLNERLVNELVAFARKRFGDTWRCFADDFDDPVEAAQLFLPWALYQLEIESGTVLDHYVAMRRAYLSAPERAWHAAQQASWLSVWEVIAVEPGSSVALRDLLTGEERKVSDTTASRTLVARDAVLARVVDVEGVSLFNGLHPRGLPPREASEVVRLVRAGLPGRGALTPAQIRDNAVGRSLIGFWEQALAAFDERPSLPQALRNTDGDPFLLTTDHFDIAPGAASAVEAQLAAIPDVEPPEPDEDPPMYVFKRPGNAMHKHWDNTIIGNIRVSGAMLRVETNSIKRADALRAQIEACGDGVRHRLREHADPLSEKAPRRKREAAPEPMPAEAAQAVREYMKRHYTEWLDTPLPALRGKTPRQAVKTRKGQAEVDLLLREFENMEQRRPDGPPFDFSWLRRELHLDEPRT